MRKIGLVVAVVLLAAFSFSLAQKALAATPYTITFKDNNGNTISTATAEAGATVALPNYPSGAIAWVDTADPNATSVNPAAKGMAYINYSAADPTNSAPAPSNMTLTMPARNMTLTAFYGNYQNGNEPRLIQYHLELKYYDVNSGCGLAFQQQYRNVNAPSGYVINLPDENYFAPISVTATNCTDLSQNGTYTSGLVIDKWVNDASYTGTTTPPADKLFDPTAPIYVDPNNYNEIYDVMIDQTLDWETGVEVPPPAPPQPPTIVNPPVTPISFVTLTFNIAPGSPTGAGFTYSDDTGVSHNVSIGNDLTITKTSGTSWGDMFGYANGGLPPVHDDAPGYATYYWTQDGGTSPINLGINPTTPILQDGTFTLHYVQDVSVTFNIDPVVYDSEGAPLTDTAYSIGAGFTYSNTQGSGSVSCTSPACTDEYVQDVPFGTTWGNEFGIKSGATTINVPIHTDVPGYTFYWTDESGNVVNNASLAPNGVIDRDHTFTLHYVNPALPAPAPTTDIVIKLHTYSHEYTGDEWTVSGWDVTDFNRTASPNLTAADQAATIQLPDGNYLIFTGRDVPSRGGTDVGTYPFSLISRDFTVCAIDQKTCAPANNVTTNYKLTILPGGLTITPTAGGVVPCVGAGCDSNGATNPIIPGVPNTGILKP